MNKCLPGWLVWLVFPLTASAQAAADCSITQTKLDRGERATLRICGSGINAASKLAGLKNAGIELLYRQNLRQCDFFERTPGLLLEVQASGIARSTQIAISTPDDAEPVCAIPLVIPSYHLLPPARLTALEQPNVYQLDIVADATTSLLNACDSEIVFPASSGPAMSLTDPKPACTQEKMSTTVKLTPGPQQAAKVVVLSQNNAGKERKTISYIEPPVPYFSNDMQEADARYVDVNGVRTRYFDQGSGEVLVLVHGGQPSAPDFNAWEWQQNFAELAQQFRVIAVDRIGQGGTDNPADLADYENYYELVVQHLRGFLDALELERVHLVGHSQGGWPVTRITLDQPQRVASLVIVDSTMVAISSNPVQAVRFYMYHQANLHPTDGPTPQSVRRGLESFSYSNNYITQQRIERILAISRTEKFRAAEAWFAKSRMSPAHPSFRKLKDEIWTELLAGKLATPTLIIWGREDPEGSFPAGVAMAEALQKAGSPVRFHAFEQAGHVSYMEYPQQFNAVLATFLQSRQ